MQFIAVFFAFCIIVASVASFKTLFKSRKAIEENQREKIEKNTFDEATKRLSYNRSALAVMLVCLGSILLRGFYMMIAVSVINSVSFTIFSVVLLFITTMPTMKYSENLSKQKVKFTFAMRVSPLLILIHALVFLALYLL